MARALADTSETRHGENPTTQVKQRLTLGIRFALDSALLLPTDNHPDAGRKTPLEPICAAASIQAVNGARWWDSERSSRMAARRKTIWVAWDQPAVSWPAQIKIAMLAGGVVAAIIGLMGTLRTGGQNGAGGGDPAKRSDRSWSGPQQWGKPHGKASP